LERDFLFTTTQFITVEMLDKIQEEMRPDETLLICCKAYQPECENRHTAITIKKIPSLLLHKCEFGKDDYSLKIVQLPSDDSEENPEEEPFEVEIKTSKSVTKPEQPSLFD
jgi:adenine-specific DNA-methyltransferase